MGLLWLTTFLVALSFGGMVEAEQKRKMLLVEVDSQEADKAETKETEAESETGKGADYGGFNRPKLLDCWKRKGVIQRPRSIDLVKPGIL